MVTNFSDQTPHPMRISSTSSFKTPISAKASSAIPSQVYHASSSYILHGSSWRILQLCVPSFPIPHSVECLFIFFADTYFSQIINILVWLKICFIPGRSYVSTGLITVTLATYRFSAIFQVLQTLLTILAVPQKGTFCRSSTGHSILISFSHVFISLLTVAKPPIIIGTTFTVSILQILPISNIKGYFFVFQSLYDPVIKI